MESRSVDMQTGPVLPRSVGERFDQHSDGHIHGKVPVDLLSHEPGRPRRLLASGRDHMVDIVHDHFTVGHLFRLVPHGKRQR